jgi:hypothetical protein
VIYSPYLARCNRFALDLSGSFLGLTDTTVLYDNGQAEDIHYLLAVLNSKVLTYRFRYIGKLVGGGSYEYFENSIVKLPIPRSHPGNAAHDRLVTLAKAVIEEKLVFRSTRVPREQNSALAKIQTILDEIDSIVGKLFNLTQQELNFIAAALVT